MKKIKKTVIFPFLLFPIIFILNVYTSIPAKIIITQNSQYELKLDYPCSVNGGQKTEMVSVTNEPLTELDNRQVILNTESCGNYDLSVKLFNKIPIKTIAVTVAPVKYVVPSGDTIGIKLYTNGLLVVALSDFLSADGVTVSPAKEAGLQKGDRIMSINGMPVSRSEELTEQIRKLPAPITLSIVRNDQPTEIQVMPKRPADDENAKLGIWVRDSTAGIGTLTYYDPLNSAFAALGHAICDTDTGEIMSVRQGNVLTCDILSITKGSAGAPGELIGSFSNTTLGDIQFNNELGIYGSLTNYTKIDFSEAVGVATRFQIKEGPAEVIADIDGGGTKRYTAEIIKVSKSTKIDNKGLIVKITDPVLIEKTGGIVQGMSGAPIIQNNLLIGAVTHVFVNDPTKGYGIFAENLLNITNTMN